MARNARAVLCREWDKPVVVETIEVDAPRRGEVMVKIAACGVCHSDLSATNGTIPMPPPLVLGHEAAGVVAEVGEGVTDLAVGDTSISSFVTCAASAATARRASRSSATWRRRRATRCPTARRRTRDAAGNAAERFSGCGVMAEYATLAATAWSRSTRTCRSTGPRSSAAAVMTGVGAVFNTAKVEPGDRGRWCSAPAASA